MAEEQTTIEDAVQDEDKKADVKAEKPERKPNKLSLEIEIPTDDGVETKTIWFKPLNLVPLGIVRRTRKNLNEQMWAVFEWAMSEDDLQWFDQLPLKELQNINERMADASEVDLGE